jgi:SAM-dependent methyltransferase
MQTPRPDDGMDTPECCASGVDPRIAGYFDRKMHEQLARGELPALHGVSRRLLAELVDGGEVGRSVLELGCGSGALSVALVERGARRADGVDLSAASIELARRRAAEAGVAERASFEVGDGASVRLMPHDWVVLDRVICCYRDVDRLLANSIGAAHLRYAFSVPDSRGLRGIINRAFAWLENTTNWLRGRPCPGYVHPIRRIELALVQAGFRELRSKTVGLWHVAVFQRAAERV